MNTESWERVKEDFELECRDFALAKIPELARAAREGYAVAGKVRDWVAAAISEEIKQELERQFCDPSCKRSDPLIHTEGTREWYEYTLEERTAPTAYAFDVRDAVVRAVERVARPASLRAVVSRVSRLDHRGGGEAVTVVTVRLKCNPRGELYGPVGECMVVTVAE